MRKLICVAAVSLLAVADVLAQHSPDWVKETGAAGWKPRDSQGELVYQDKMWIFGGWFNSYEAPPRDVWNSSDGRSWNLVQKSAPWLHSDLSMAITFDDKMWFMGGWYNGRLEGHSASNQVWFSTDGARWERATESAGWSPRIAAAVVQFKGKMWLLGGTENYYFGDDSSLKNDVWSSADGKRWELVTAKAPWSPRAYHQAVVLNDRIYLFGGGNYVPKYHALNDVWSSDDGVHWNRLPDAPWHPRLWFPSVVYRDRMWVLGGWSNNPSTNWGDVWYSADGSKWHPLESRTIWKERHEHSAFVFRDRLWVAGGHARPLSSEVWSLDVPKEFFAQDYASELPRIAPKTAQESLKAIRLKEGFHAELVASEPLIRSPMAMDFDEFGRGFVVELPEYNQYASSKPHGHGSVKMLEDLDGDGSFDRASVYVDQLNYPTAVACWNGGVIVGVAPDILFCKDTDGDGKADVRQKLFTGFGQDKAGEGMLNSFRWRIDNRFHIPTGLDGGEIVPVVSPGSKQRVRPSEPINVRGQHLVLDPLSMTIRATSGGGQHGMDLDSWNLHQFVCGNSQPVHLIMYDGRYLARNVYLKAPAAAINIAPDGKFTKLMRISAVEPWRVLRTRLRSAGAIPGSDEGGKPSGFFTGATGITVYRGDAFPAEFRDQLFVGEVANNLVYRAELEPNGVGLTARRADTDAEFLASSDNWFRPVQFANAPDGTLYILDMYRELIEGAAFLAPQILRHMDTAAGHDKGRIYRIAPDGFVPKPAPRLGDLSAAELVAVLEHPNGWHRNTASRLIYERQDRTAVRPLRKLAVTSKSGLARVAALYSLQGLAALEPERVVRALRSESPRVKRHALRLAEPFPSDATVVAAAAGLAGDEHLRVRYQAAFSLGEFSTDAASKALLRLARKDGKDSWMRLAILSSVGERRGEFLTLLLRDPVIRDVAHVRELALELSSQIGASNSTDDIAMLLAQIESLSESSTHKRLAQELVKRAASQRPATRRLLGSAAGGNVKEILAEIIRDAVRTASDGSKQLKQRVTAVRTLATANFTEVRDLLAELLQTRQPPLIQLAAIEAAAQMDHPQVAELIIAAWPSQTPQLRASSLEALLSRPEWIAAFFDAVEEGIIARGELDAARVGLLKNHPRREIRSRSEKLFANLTLARRQEVFDAYEKALELSGDVGRGRTHFRKTCAACHRLEEYGDSIGADLKAIRDRGASAVMLNILDPNREVKPQFRSYVLVLSSGRSLTGMITAETANSLTIRKADKSTETILRVDIEQLKSTGLSFMPEGLEKQLDLQAMADLLAYLSSIE